MFYFSNYEDPEMTANVLITPLASVSNTDKVHVLNHSIPLSQYLAGLIGSEAVLHYLILFSFVVYVFVHTFILSDHNNATH